jgi:inorganic pyrophosphatase
MQKSGKPIVDGDHDPLDILVLSEHHIPRGDIILKAAPIGGFCLIDNGEADDKIIATLVGDKVYENYKDLTELPEGIVNRLQHYFLTYKTMPGVKSIIDIAYIYGREESYDVIREAAEDYRQLLSKPT